MADALVSGVLKQLASIVAGELSDELKLLRGVEKEIQKLKTDFEAIKEVLDDAEKRSLKEKNVKTWVDHLEDICYDMEDVLDNCSITETVLQRERQPVNRASWRIEEVMPCISSLPPWIRRVVWKRSIALRTKDINRRLDVVVNDKDRFNFNTGTTANEPERPQTVSFSDVSEFHGRDDVKKSLIRRLLDSERGQEEEHDNLTITAIVGMAGIGKTALAQMAFNDESVKKHFKLRIWVCVSHPFNAANIARAIIEGLYGRPLDLIQLQCMLQEVSRVIAGRRFLLILDDVWNEDYSKWKPLRNCLENGARGSKILVTTRKKRVADIMEATNPIPLEKLSTEVCWYIFSKIALFRRSRQECVVLQEMGRKISKRCKGLPLAAKVLGGLSSGVEWQKVLGSDLWALEGANKHINPVFMLSYYDLPSPMKRCFTYCAIFPEDAVIRRDRLIQLWMANGFLGGTDMEETGEKYIETLATQSLFQDVTRDYLGRIRSCKMHDLVRKFALRVSRNECGAIEVYKDGEALMMKQEQEQEPAYATLRHARLTFRGGDHSSPSALSKFGIKGLRSLVTTELEASDAEMKILGGLFCGLTNLRTLELRKSNIKELPVEIEKLMHLRYLGLEGNVHLKELLETVCDLCNLQTLKLTYCSRMKRLPRGIGKLSNLRHLECNYLTVLPKGIAQLTSLRTLRGHVFYKREEDGSFGIGDLEKLNCLRGDLVLKWLGDAELGENSRFVGEAKRAGLKNKKNLRSLSLYFDGSSSGDEGEEERAERHLSIAKAFKEPPPHQETLAFYYYKGRKLPSWITSLSGLKILHLKYCPNLMELPRDLLGRLQKVRIVDCPTLEEHCRRRKRENGEFATLFTFNRT